MADAGVLAAVGLVFLGDAGIAAEQVVKQRSLAGLAVFAPAVGLGEFGIEVVQEVCRGRGRGSRRRRS